MQTLYEIRDLFHAAAAHLTMAEPGERSDVGRQPFALVTEPNQLGAYGMVA